MPAIVERICPWPNDLLVARRLRRHAGQLLSQCATRDRHAIAIDAIVFKQNFQHLRNATGAMEINRNEAARGLQITYDRRPPGNPFEIVDIPAYTCSFGYGEKMEHSIGRPAGCHDYRDGI